MKRILIITLMMVSFGTFAQTPIDKQAILNVLEKQRLNWNKGDLGAFMQGYVKSDSLLFVGQSGPTYGWQKTLDNYKKTYQGKAGMGQLTFGIKKVDFLNKDVAFVLGSWHLKREKDEPQGYFTLLFKKLNGEWKIFVDHSS
ncbi:nuclear transport factor 2 family protein [Pedobacter frigidisoli]|uniref:Nuclear transport factor 2 family protein n=1 Tax=Pedobacter frigidisoli TaxID=2530455 RepID=A0A4R0PA01_9SPHI|nr:nuclear transport factor 2 family protein [Pedobacter frigidisoli]TCD12588.1 nuclear transport factor 2 family protein [Pedobacter frigidisoli]